MKRSTKQEHKLDDEMKKSCRWIKKQEDKDEPGD